MGGGCSAHDSIHSASQADGQTHLKFKPKRRLFPVFSRFQVLHSNHNCSIALLGIQNKHTHFHCSIRLYIFHFIKFKSIPTPSPQWTWPHLRRPRLQHNTFFLFSSILKFCNAYQNFPSIWTRRNCQNLLVTRKKWRKYFFYWYVHECVCVYQCCCYCCYCCCWCLCIDAVVVGFLSHVHTLFVDWNLLWSLGRRFFAKARGVSIVGISRTSWRTFGYKIHVGSSKVDDNMRHRWLWIQGPLLSNTQTIQMSTQCGH